MRGLFREFSDFVLGRWEGDFPHAYPVTGHRSWDQWRDGRGADGRQIWSCASLEQAASNYSWWPPSTHPPSFQDLSQKLRSAIAAGDDRGAASVCREIFQWGGVGRLGRGRRANPSQGWIKDQADRETLCASLSHARACLVGDDGLDAFDGKRFLMNSAMAKVYAAADPEKLAIYDGRVGAALGLLARDFLQLGGHHSVPGELAFRWGSSRNACPGRRDQRDPSKGNLRFPRLFVKNGNQDHALMMQRTSLLLRDLAGRSGAKLTDWEKALFMVGYDIGRRHQSQDAQTR